MNAGLVRNLGLALAATLLTLGAAEIGVRLLVPVRNVGPSYTVYDSQYGKVLKRSFHTVRRTPEFSNTFTTNSLGFHGPEPESPVAGGLLFIGDSYTMGFGVNDGEEFPELIRRRLVALGQNIPVVNNGIGDTGNGRWLKFLGREGHRLKPRFVILQMSENDFGDNVNEGLFSIAATGDLVQNPVPPPGWPRMVQEWIETVPGLPYSYLIGLLRQGLPSLRAKRPGTIPASAPTKETTADTDVLTYRLVQETLNLCRQNAWPVLALEVGIAGPRLSALRKVFGERDVTLIEIPFRPARPDLYYRIDGHWNVRGHQWVADTVYQQLQAAGALRN